MKRKILSFAAILLVSICSYAQNNDAVIKALYEQANDMGKKFISQDYAGFLKYSHPSTIKAMGGEKKAVEKITTEMLSIGKDGIIVTKLTFGTPSKIIIANDELQCTVPQIMEMHVPGGKITSTNTMLAISNDKGKNWYFLDTANYSFDDMKMLLPNLSDQIVIPERTDPAFEETPKEDGQSE
jgi:hypothetical protein